MKNIIYRDMFGICPMCNYKMYLFASTYQLFELSDCGNRTKELNHKSNYSHVCPNCKFKIPMKNTIEGMVPIPYGNNKDEDEVKLEKPNSIGVVVNG